MKYLLVSALIALPSFAQTNPSLSPLLSLEQYSGYTSPESAFEAHCALEPFVDTANTGNLTARVSAKVFRDRTGTDGAWKIETNVEKILSDSEFTQVQAWINAAEAGPFKQGATPCDIGTLIIKTPTYPIVISKGCGKKVENLNPAAANLITWFRQACQLEGKKR